MDNKVRIDPAREVTASRGLFRLNATSVSMSVERAADRRVPPSIPESQRFFWTRHWQAGESESLADIAAGRVHDFDNALDAVRYLLSDDE